MISINFNVPLYFLAAKFTIHLAFVECIRWLYVRALASLLSFFFFHFSLFNAKDVSLLSFTGCRRATFISFSCSLGIRESFSIILFYSAISHLFFFLFLFLRHYASFATSKKNTNLSVCSMYFASYWIWQSQSSFVQSFTFARIIPNSFAFNFLSLLFLGSFRALVFNSIRFMGCIAMKF